LIQKKAFFSFCSGSFLVLCGGGCGKKLFASVGGDGGDDDGGGSGGSLD